MDSRGRGVLAAPAVAQRVKPGFGVVADDAAILSQQLPPGEKLNLRPPPPHRLGDGPRPCHGAPPAAVAVIAGMPAIRAQSSRPAPLPARAHPLGTCHHTGPVSE